MAVEDRLNDALAGFSTLTSDDQREPEAEVVDSLIPDDAASVELADDSQPVPRPRGGPLIAMAACLVVLAVAAGIWLAGRTPSAEAAGQAPSPEAAPTVVRKPGMPDAILTPGHRAQVPLADVPVSAEAANDVMAAYAVDPAKHEVVRLIPASLGGTDDPRNLFPVTPWFADLKERLDRKLTALVESKTLTVEEAEAQLTGNWIEAVHRNYVRNYGHQDQKAAKEQEDNLVW